MCSNFSAKHCGVQAVKEALSQKGQRMSCKVFSFGVQHAAENAASLFSVIEARNAAFALFIKQSCFIDLFGKLL